MNPEQQQSYIRSALLTIVGSLLGGAVVKGWISADQATVIGGGVVALIMAGGAYALARWGASTHSAPAVVSAATTAATTAATGANPSSAALSSALVDAVNSNAVKGVKVVAAGSPSPSVAVDATTGTVVPK